MAQRSKLLALTSEVDAQTFVVNAQRDARKEKVNMISRRTSSLRET